MNPLYRLYAQVGIELLRRPMGEWSESDWEAVRTMAALKLLEVEERDAGRG
jgi:hypothetical protein